MTTVKIAAKHQNRQGVTFMGIGLVWAGLMALVFSQIDSVGLQQAIGLVSFIGVIAAMLYFMVKVEKAFKCPDCGGPVNDALGTDGKANTPILRLCPGCDVLWQTGTIPD
jgi:hypothetical protein